MFGNFIKMETERYLGVIRVDSNEILYRLSIWWIFGFVLRISVLIKR